jgi:hypothetical protein
MNFGDPSLPQRIWDKLIPEPNSGCWIWLGAQDHKGYGKVWWKGRADRIHRIVKRFRRTAHHKCFNTLCANPDHLADISRAKNSHLGHFDQGYLRAYAQYLEAHQA